MASVFLARHSIKLKVTLTMVAIFLASLWSLAFYANRMLRIEMERLLGDQQAASAATVAANIHGQMRDRLAALENMALQLGPTLSGQGENPQAFLEQRRLLYLLFNGGAFVTRTDGTAIASLPLSAGRLGVNYLGRDYILTALREGKAFVGEPVMGKQIKAPIIGMGVPIRDPQGKVIGAVAGVTNLAIPNFLDPFTAGTLGKSGYYLLETAKNRLIITGTDKRRIMQALPPPGQNPLIDRHVQGSDETGVTLGGTGIEVLASAKRIGVGDWFLVAALPTAEAFAPIQALSQRLLLATILLTVLVGGVAWWLLQRQLEPMVATAKALATLAPETGGLRPLSITGQDEIGDMIGGFNCLLQTLAERDQSLRESEHRFRSYVDHSPFGVFVCDEKGHYLEVNPAATAITGYACEELLGLSIPDILPPESQEFAALLFKEVAETGRTSGEFAFKHKDGRIGMWSLEGVRLSPTRFMGLVTDITERKVVEEKLKSSEANFRAFFDTMTDLIMVGTPDGRLIFTNAAVTRTLGYSAEELATMHILDVHPVDKRQEAEAIFAAMFRGERGNCPLPLAAKGGALIPVETRAWFGQWNGQDCIFGISKDLTAEQEAQQRFERLFRHSPTLMALSSLPGRRFTDVNEAFLDALGYSRSEVIGKTAAELGLFPNPEQQAALGDKVQAEGRIADFELKIQRKTGELLDGIFSGEVISSQGQQYFLTVMIDITERKQAEEALQKSEERHRSILNASPDDITIADLEGRILMVSPAALTMFGAEREEELLGHLVTEFIAPEDRDRASTNVAALLQGVRSGSAEYRGLRHDGSTFAMEVNRELTRDSEGQPTGLVFVVRDVTQRKQAEEERLLLAERMNQVQKLEALGTLVGGVAHNFNNILAVIMGAASIREALATETKDLKTYTLIGKACRRGRDVVKSLIQFAQPFASNQAPCDLHALIKGLRILLESTSGNRIEIVEAFAEEPLWLQGDAGSLSSALMNLCLNSLDAMPNGGTFTFRTAAPEKDWINVSVEDTGEGMTPEILMHAMEPFFTTKEVGKGIGLGLSMTHGVIKAHGGTLEISSVVGQGTIVKLRLPRIPAPAQEETISEAPASTLRPLNVLLVDDDEDVRFLTARMLKNAGHQIKTVAGGEEALGSLDVGPLPDLIILDQNMPRMNGIQTMEKIRALHLEMPILISSGQPGIEGWDCFKRPNVVVISKPFEMDELLAKLAKMSLKALH